MNDYAPSRVKLRVGSCVLLDQQGCSQPIRQLVNRSFFNLHDNEMSMMVAGQTKQIPFANPLESKVDLAMEPRAKTWSLNTIMRKKREKWNQP